MNRCDKHFTRDIHRCDRGSTILEFAATLPIVVLILVSVIEIGNAVNQYLQVSRVSYEGARYGAALAGLEEGNFVHTDTGNEIVYQQKLQQRVLTLLTDYGYDTSQATITTSRNPIEGGSTFEAVGVRIEIPVRPILFSQYSSIVFDVTSSAPYLFNSDEV